LVISKSLVTILYGIGFYDFDMWPFSIIFGLYFLKRYDSQNIYRHHTIPLIILFIICICLIFSSSFLPPKEDEEDPTNINTYEYTEQIAGSKFFSIFVILVLLFKCILMSFSRVNFKKLMERYYFDPYSIIFFTGCFGLLISVIILIFSSSFHCTNDKLKCKLKDNNSDSKYFESFKVYYQNLNYYYQNDSSVFWADIFAATPIISLLSVVQFYLELLIIYYLNPIYFLTGDTIFFGVKAVIDYVPKIGESNQTKFLLQFFSNILYFIGNLIYLEIIELKFCKFNLNTRKNIIKRADNDSNPQLPSDDTFYDLYDQEIEL
jgi:hypothetical protein